MANLSKITVYLTSFYSLHSKLVYYFKSDKNVEFTVLDSILVFIVNIYLSIRHRKFPDNVKCKMFFFTFADIKITIILFIGTFRPILTAFYLTMKKWKMFFFFLLIFDLARAMFYKISIETSGCFVFVFCFLFFLFFFSK